MEEAKSPAGDEMKPFENPKKKSEGLGKRFKLWISTPQGKKQLGIILIILVILIAGGVVAYQRYGPEKTANPESTNNIPSGKLPSLETSKANTVESRFDGLQYSPDIANRAPLAVIVENHTDARPQYGLDKASLVFEAIAEGGITRFMAIYGPQDADTVGPVRSIRTYFLDWAEGLNAFTAHVGGNIDALDRIQAEPVKDLDEFANPSAYWRDSKGRKVATEHTMFASTKKLYELAKKKGWDTNAQFSGYTFKDDPIADQRPANQTVDIKFGSALYDVKYTYNQKDNYYSRFMGGVSHKDAQTGEQIKVKNIVTMEVKRTSTLTRINETGYVMQTTGTGKATMFIDGKQIDGTWKKDSKTSMIEFTDSSGKKVEFSRGNTWFEILPQGESGSSITVS